MNKERRKVLSQIAKEAEELQSRLEDIANEEREAFDSLSEGLQATMRGQEMEENADRLDEAVTLFEEIIDTINDVI